MTWDDSPPATSPWEALSGLVSILETLYGIGADLWDRAHKKPEQEHADPKQLQEILQDHEDRLGKLEDVENPGTTAEGRAMRRKLGRARTRSTGPK